MSFENFKKPFEQNIKNPETIEDDIDNEVVKFNSRYAEVKDRLSKATGSEFVALLTERENLIESNDPQAIAHFHGGGDLSVIDAKIFNNNKKLEANSFLEAYGFFAWRQELVKEFGVLVPLFLPPAMLVDVATGTLAGLGNTVIKTPGKIKAWLENRKLKAQKNRESGE